MELRNTNKAGRHLSTARAIQLLEEHGVETAQGLVKRPSGLLRRPTVNRYLSLFRLNHSCLLREPPAVRFQAECINDCWQFDMSASDLKHFDCPNWIDPAHGLPTLMLFSVVDERSGVTYQEYRCVYGEDAESALRFLFNAMAPKSNPKMPFQGQPKILYLDNGPVAKSHGVSSRSGSHQDPLHCCGGPVASAIDPPNVKAVTKDVHHITTLTGGNSLQV